MPDWAREVRTRLSSLRLSPTREAEIVDELSQHLDDRYRELIAGGASHEEATRVALADFRSDDVLAQQMASLRQAHVPAPITPGERDTMRAILEAVIQDIRYALRTLRRAPAVSLAVIVALTLALGANTAIFSLVDTLLLRNLPVRQPEQLVVLSRSFARGNTQPFSYPFLRALREHDPVFAERLIGAGGVSVVRADRIGRSTDLANRELRVTYVSGTYFPVLGVTPAIGRLLTPEDDRTNGAEPVAVIGYGLWQRAFGGHTSVLGETVRIGDATYTIVGVTPRGFFGIDVGDAADMWLSTAMAPPGFLTARRDAWLRLLFRLPPEMREEQVAEQASAVLRRFLNEDLAAAPPSVTQQERQAYVDQRVQVASASRGLSVLRQQTSRPLLVLMIMVSVLLLVAAGNIANVLLARTYAREKELATRLAVGASSARVAMQVATESILIACIAAVLGVFFAPLLTSALISLLAEGRRPDAIAFTADARVLLFTAAAALVVGVLCGLTPAIRAIRTDPGPILKEGNQAVRGTGKSLRTGKVLVVVQIALSTVLVSGASLLVQTFHKLSTIDPGFDLQQVVLVRLQVPNGGPTGQQLWSQYDQLLDQVRALPGVRVASLASESFFSATTRLGAVFVRGVPLPPRRQDLPLSRMMLVSPGFFEAMGMPLVRGRGFSEREVAGTPKVAVVNESLARRHFPNGDPIGLRFGKDRPNQTEDIEIIGLVKDVKLSNLRDESPRTFFLPLLQTDAPPKTSTLVVRATGDSAALLQPIRQLIDTSGLRFEVQNATTQQQMVDDSLRQERLLAQLSSVFGTLALLLACIGVFGVISYTAARRTPEFGLRLALGADQTTLTWLMLRETMILVIAGVAIGAAVAFAAGGVLKTLLYESTPTDPAPIAAATLLVVLVAVLAGAIPARRASRVDPVVALRADV